MSELATQQCEACNADAPKVTDDEKQAFGEQIPEWSIVTIGGEEQLERTFKFKNFVQALAFTNTVGDLAEQEGHHPAIITEYGKVTVRWWTHKIGGLHRNDFVMSARTDDAYTSQ